MKGEIWKDIKGYDVLYQVSNMGNVKSLNYNHTGKERIMKPQKNNNGYLQVQLCKDGKAKMYLVHQLVATVFCENPHGFKEVNHIDEDKTNNCVENLEYCSRSYNLSYNDRAKKVAERLRGRKQSEETIKKKSKPVIAIHKINGLVLEFSSIIEAERETGIANSHICACCKGKYKSAGGFVWHYVDTEE